MKLIILVVVLLVAAGFVIWAIQTYLPSPDDFNGIRVVRDDSCADEENPDACCAELHKDDITIQCAGSWQYIEDEKLCEFVCDAR